MAPSSMLKMAAVFVLALFAAQLLMATPVAAGICYETAYKWCIGNIGPTFTIVYCEAEALRICQYCQQQIIETKPAAAVSWAVPVTGVMCEWHAVFHVPCGR
ncbi:hypothetical protein VPH35_064087 [Triticum aestivum]|uniref:Uncharacterized protein n=1 Tax=Aegilops tauschii TaxID=37682 RepID=R7W626_AEGTA